MTMKTSHPDIYLLCNKGTYLLWINEIQSPIASSCFGSNTIWSKLLQQIVQQSISHSIEQLSACQEVLPLFRPIELYNLLLLDHSRPQFDYLLLQSKQISLESFQSSFYISVFLFFQGDILVGFSLGLRVVAFAFAFAPPLLFLTFSLFWIELFFVQIEVIIEQFVDLHSVHLFFLLFVYQFVHQLLLLLSQSREIFALLLIQTSPSLAITLFLLGGNGACYFQSKFFGLFGSNFLVLIKLVALDISECPFDGMQCSDVFVVVGQYGLLHFEQVIVFVLLLLVFGLVILHLNYIN